MFVSTVYSDTVRGHYLGFRYSGYKYRLLKVLFRPEHNGTSDVSLYLAVSLSRPFC